MSYPQEYIERQIYKWRNRVKKAKAQAQKEPNYENRERVKNYETELQRWKNGGHYS